MNKRPLAVLGRVVVQLLVLTLLVLTFSLAWAHRTYGNIGFQAVVFHLHMPLQGTADSLMNSFFRTALAPAVVLFLVELVLFALPARREYRITAGRKDRARQFRLYPIRPKPVLWILVLAVWTGMLLYAAEASLGMVSYYRNQALRSSFIEDVYVDPRSVELTFPQEKRNLITIFVESAETTNQDTANGGVFQTNYTPEMTRLARENVSFSQSELIEGAAVAPACGWTIAGLVAETSGLPLKLYAYDDGDSGLDNSMIDYASFMPGAVALGDLLEEQGYHNVFLAGSNFVFGGRENYFVQHGNYEIWDYFSALEEGRLPTPDYHVWWGFEDERLYGFAKEWLEKLADSGEPFNLSLITVDTHHVDGYLCPLCPNDYDSQYANIWACASAQLDGFISWVQAQPFYENTTIVVVGDHCSMQPDFYPQSDFDKHTGATDRKVYNAFINPAAQAVKEHDRLFTTMDIFPTTLAALGVEIEGHRLALGTDLFSGAPTLAEEYGYEEMFAQLDKRSDFYNNSIFFP